MKKAILISGIVWAVMCAISAIVFFAGGSFFSTMFVEIMKEQGALPEDQVKIIGLAMLSLYVGLGVVMLVAAIYSIVLVALREKKMSKGAGIAMGVVGIVLGAEVPAVLFLIDSIRSR